MSVAIGIVGDFDAANETHRLTSTALEHAGARSDWIPTDECGEDAGGRLAGYGGVWIAPGSPYRSMDGAVGAIRHARERGVPLVGT